MVNKLATGCVNHIVLIRSIVLTSKINNVRFFVRHVRDITNSQVDALSRGNIKKFQRPSSQGIDDFPTPVPSKLLPPEKLWRKVNLKAKFGKQKKETMN